LLSFVVILARVYEPRWRKIIDRRDASVPLGDRRPGLVSYAIPAAAGNFRREISSQTMTAWHTLDLCVALAVSVLLLCGAGAFLLRVFRSFFDVAQKMAKA
jgi:hypothetical protein